MEDKRADMIASATQKVGMAAGAHSILKALGFCGIVLLVALFFHFIGFPWYVSAIMVLVAIGIVVLEVMTLKRTAGVNLQELNQPMPEEVELEPGEVVTDTIPAVMQYLTTRSVSSLGTGKVLTPENALIVTDRAIWALTVPLPGADKVVAGVDIGKQQWMWAYQDIEDKLREMLDTLPLQEVLRQGRAKRLMSRTELKNAKSRILSQDICLVKSNGKKYRYSIRTREHYQRAKEIFKID